MFRLGIKRCLLLSLGTAALALGVVGIFLPILPTTPFLLLTSFCYLRSSQRMHNWLLGHPILGRYLQDYIRHRAVPRRAKILALGTLWPSLTCSVFLIPLLPVKILVGVVGLIVSIHILRLKERTA